MEVHELILRLYLNTMIHGEYRWEKALLVLVSIIRRRRICYAEDVEIEVFIDRREDVLLVDLEEQRRYALLRGVNSKILVKDSPV